MKNTSTWLLLIGDLVVLGLFAFFGVFHYSSPPKPLFDLLIVPGPYPAAWLLVSPRVRSLDPRAPVGVFMQRSASTWLAAGILAEATRGIVLWFAVRVIHLPLASLLILIEGAIFVLAWRLGFKILFDITVDPHHPVRKRLVWGGLFGLIGLGLAATLPFCYASIRYSEDIYTHQSTPEKAVALVLGAGVYPDGTPSQVVVARVETAAELFHAGKIQTLILSGDAREAEAMLRLALKSGVPEEALIVDPAGYDTYTSCYRAKAEYRLSQAVVISQRFHLGRAMFTCDTLGIETVGVPAATPRYSLRTLAAWYLREIPATALAWWQVNNRTPIAIEGSAFP